MTRIRASISGWHSWLPRASNSGTTEARKHHVHRHGVHVSPAQGTPEHDTRNLDVHRSLREPSELFRRDTLPVSRRRIPENPGLWRFGRGRGHGHWSSAVWWGRDSDLHSGWPVFPSTLGFCTGFLSGLSMGSYGYLEFKMVTHTAHRILSISMLETKANPIIVTFQHSHGQGTTGWGHDDWNGGWVLEGILGVQWCSNCLELPASSLHGSRGLQGNAGSTFKVKILN